MTGLRTLLAITPFLIPTLASAEPPPAEGVKYYILLFSGQAESYRSRTAHTWATFVKGVPDKTGGGTILESMTISWLPEELPVRPLKLRPVAGRNYGLAETLDIFNTGRSELGLWGPYEIRAEWYAGAAEHKKILDGGAIGFATLDRGPFLKSARVRHPEISHCVHAVTRTWEPLREASNPVISYGELVTRKVAESMKDVGLFVDPGTKHDWLIAPLGADRVPSVRRNLGEPVLKVLR
jgi:hypothetical protein